MLLNTSITGLRYREGEMNQSCPNGNAKAEDKRDKPRESTSTVSPALAANLS